MTDVLRRWARILAAGFAATFALAAGATAEKHEQTVRFEVPVTLVDIHPDIKSFSVDCAVGKFQHRTLVKFERNFSGVVEVKSPPIPVNAALTIKSWRCRLFLLPGGTGSGTPSYDSKIEMYKAKARTKLVTEVKGTIGAAPPVLRAVPHKKK